MMRENFQQEYGNFGIRPPAALGSYPPSSVPGIFSNIVAKPVNPESLMTGDVVNELTFVGSNLISSHFKLSYKLGTISIYQSDGTTPNGNLSANQGDICFGADSGKAYYCSTAPTTWTAL